MNMRVRPLADDIYEQFKLPDGTLIVHQNKVETDLIYSEIFDNQCYLKHGITLTDAKCIFDVGANIGLFSLYASRTAPLAAIFAFEPLPRIYEALRLNKRLCRIDNLLPLPYGLSDSGNYETFTYYPERSIRSHKMGNRGFEETSSCRQVLCRLLTLSEIIREYRIGQIDLLKLHAEGSELDILTGILPADWPKIRQVAARVHDGNGELRRLCALLERQGFHVATAEHGPCAGGKVCMAYATR